MSILNNSLLLGADAGAAGGYQISRSVRLNAPDSAYLSRTPGTAGNRKTWTWAGWVKTASFTRTQFLFGAGDTFAAINANGTSSDCELYFNLRGSSTNYFVSYAPKLRDPSAWYHLVFAVDTTQGTPANRLKVYINGVQATAAGGLGQSFPPQNDSLSVNNTVAHTICGSYYFDGLLAECYLLDGIAADPSSFGEFDTNGVWQPIEYTGAYNVGVGAVNGFHLPFSDNSTAAALGTDTSGNGNTWTVNNISVTAGAGNDSLVDSPTNGSQVDTGAGGEVVGNYATLSPLLPTLTPTNGNLDTPNSSGQNYSTIAISTGKWYLESTVGPITAGTGCGLGLHFNPSADAGPGFYNSGAYIALLYENILARYEGVNSGVNFYPTAGAGSILAIKIDLDSGTQTISYYVNNVLITSSNLPAGKTWFVTTRQDNNQSLNFGQRPFAYTAPSGFEALCTTNLPEPTIADGSTVMDVVLDTGANILAAAQGAISGSADLLWIKDRANSNNHQLIDTVRGGTATLQSNTTAAETTYVAPSGSSVAWTWDAGGTTDPSNEAGSITSQVRANASAGFSVVTYTGTGSAATVGHGLGVAPGLIILKDRTSAYNWQVYHSTFAGTSNSIVLNSTAAVDTGSGGVWNSTAPTSTVFSIGTSVGVNTNGNNYVAYCFAPVAGYSSFGSYTGNGADGPFVFCNFRPRWVMIKRSSATENWMLYDAARSSYNASNDILRADISEVELSDYTAGDIDLLSNGFKLRGTWTGINASGSTYIYAAFAEHPFATSRAR